MAGVRIERQARLSPPATEAFSAIYETSFPACERDDTASLLASIEAGDRDCAVASFEGDVVGLAVTKAFSIGGSSALEYLAVAEAVRNQGIGARLLASLMEQFTTGVVSPDAGLILEVDPPEASSGTERDLRRRRIGFYQRNGASVIDCAPAYRAPNLETEGTLPYVLMWRPAIRSAGPPTGEFLRSLVKALLTESYELDPNDPLVLQVLDDLAC